MAQTKQERRAKQREWEALNMARVREHKRKWREAHPDQHKLCQRNYYEQNKPRIQERLKLYKRKIRSFLKPKLVTVAKDAEAIKSRQFRFYHANKARLRAKQNAYRKANREHVREQRKKYTHKHRAKCKESARRYRRKWKSENPDRLRLQMKRWRDSHKSQIREYYRNRYHNNPMHAIRCRLSCRISKVLRRNGTYKSNRTMDLIGLSLPEFKAYLESNFKPGMTWENRHLWHIDHKMPCASFNLIDPEQQKLCFHYTNLEPLWWRDNLSKADKIPSVVP